jgi:hypothetical protein
LILGWVFFASIPDILNTITNKTIKEKLAATSDPALIEELNTQMMYLNGSRLLLLAIFAGLSYLVFIAYKKRKKVGRCTS